MKLTSLYTTFDELDEDAWITRQKKKVELDKGEL